MGSQNLSPWWGPLLNNLVRVCLYYILRQPHCVKIQAILQTKIRRSQYHWNQEGPNSSTILSLHRCLKAQTQAKTAIKKVFVRWKEVEIMRRKKNCSQQCQEGRKEKLTSITFESNLGKLNSKREQGSCSRWSCQAKKQLCIYGGQASSLMCFCFSVHKR